MIIIMVSSLIMLVVPLYRGLTRKNIWWNSNFSIFEAIGKLIEFKSEKSAQELDKSHVLLLLLWMTMLIECLLLEVKAEKVCNISSE